MNGNFIKNFFIISLCFLVSTLFANEEIEILVSSNSSIYLKVLSGLKYSLEYPTKIIYLSEFKDDTNFITDNKLDNQRPIITIGNPATSFIREKTNRKNIFSVTNFSKEIIQYQKGNSCGSFAEVPIENIFKNLNELFPSVKKITSFISTNKEGYYNTKGPQVDLFYGLEYKIIETSNDKDFRTQVEKLKGNTDAFFIIPDPIYSRENFEYISNFAAENKILLLSNIGSLSDLGVAFTLDLDYFDVGLKLGQLANKVLKNQIECNKGPYNFTEKETLKINTDYLQKSGFLITDTILQKTEIDRLYNTSVDLFLRGKKETSQNILKYLNKKYPENTMISEFLKFVIIDKYENQIRALANEGEEFLKNKKFIEARRSFSKILDINPTYPGIKEKLQEAIFLQSEQKRQEANSSENNKNYFQAIKLYTESLRILPSNTQSKNQLNALRRKLQANIPGLYAEGLNHYNNRNYTESVLIFEKILQIDSEDKRAKEYLRLSIEKQEAITKLKNCKEDKVNPCSI